MREVVDPRTGLYPVNDASGNPVPVDSAAVESSKPPVRIIQEVRLVGIARFACWWFVILSMLGIVGFLILR